ncbi:MAG: 4'-phosphopantetheinyl transferase superfamily protein [Actinomycetota bacterium]|nr:4'-phosphopantetheinyl transferase superfamily protein [Actinomycetota bacterium]
MSDAAANACVIDVWTCAHDPLRVLDAELDLLDDEERSRVEEFTSESARRTYIASHGFLRRVLGSHLGLDPAALRYDRRCEHCGHPHHGRPRLIGGLASFSLSHSGRHILIALADGPVGADIEDVTRRPVIDGVIRRCCGERERAWLEGLANRDRPAAFLGLWTKKEAVAKALGLGLVLPFSSFEVTGPDPIRAREGAPPLAAWVVDVAGAVAAVAGTPGAVVYHHAP